MRTNAALRGTRDVNWVTVDSGKRSACHPIPPKALGVAFNPSDSERLRLTPPACGTQNIDRELGGLGIAVSVSEVEARAESPAEGFPAHAIQDTVRITGRTPGAATLARAARAQRLAGFRGTVQPAVLVTLGRVDAACTA